MARIVGSSINSIRTTIKSGCSEDSEAKVSRLLTILGLFGRFADLDEQNQDISLALHEQSNSSVSEIIINLCISLTANTTSLISASAVLAIGTIPL